MPYRRRLGKATKDVTIGTGGSGTASLAPKDFGLNSKIEEIVRISVVRDTFGKDVYAPEGSINSEGNVDLTLYADSSTGTLAAEVVVIGY